MSFRSVVRFYIHSSSIVVTFLFRALHLSHNHLYYLPADITRLKLQSIDLAFNYLHSNVPVKISNIHRNFRGQLRLEDWAALNVEPHFRYLIFCTS
jgi:hypothetical protein